MFLLIEHLGSEGVLDASGRPVPERYTSPRRSCWRKCTPKAGRTVAEAAPGMLHEISTLRPTRPPHRDRTAHRLVICPSPGGGLPTMPSRRTLRKPGRPSSMSWRTGEKGLILRDYHSPNLIWQRGSFRR